MLLTALALLVTHAHAHYPHDFAFYVAVSPTSPPTWITTSLFRTEAVMAARSDNFADVEVYYVFNGSIDDGAGRAVEPRAGEFLDESRLFMASSGLGLWESLDAGATWAEVPDISSRAVLNSLESSPNIDTDHTALLAGEDGIWRSTDRGDSWTLVADLPGEIFIDVAFSPRWSVDGTACAATTVSDVYCSTDSGDSWELVGSTGTAQTWQLALDDDGHIWMATIPGLMKSEDWGESWSSVSIDTSIDMQPITTLEYAGAGVLLAATEMEAAWRSEDGGANWTLHGDDLQTPVTTSGHDDKHYFEFQLAMDGTIWLGTQEGLAWSDDMGVSWTPMETELGDTVRGLITVQGTETDNPLLLTGNYGSGVNVVDADLGEVTNISHDLEWLYLRSLSAPTDWVDSGVVAVTGSGRLYVTNDHGATWDRTMDTDKYPNASAAAPDYSSDPLLLIAAGSGPVGVFHRSTDHGQTWEEGALDGGSCGGAGTSVTFSPDFRTDNLAWGACGGTGELFVTEDAGLTWTWVGSAGVQVKDMAATPGGADVFLATDAGLFVSLDGAEPTLLDWEEQPVWGVATSPDWSSHPYVYVVTILDGWHRSDDGGVSFEPITLPTQQIPLEVSVSPEFGRDGTVSVSGFGGLWVSRDRGDSWSQGHALELYQESQPQFAFDDEAWSEAERDTVSSEDPDAELSVLFRGVGFDLVGPISEDGGRFEISVDDDPPYEVSTMGDPAQRQDLWQVDGLSDGWHEVVLTPVGDGPVEIDAARIWKLDGVEPGPDWMHGETDADTDADTDTDTDTDADTDTAPLDDTGPGDSDDTPPDFRCKGCSSGQAPTGGLWALALLGLALRRRRA